MKNYRLLITLSLFYLCSFASMATERIKILIFIESNNAIENKVKCDIKEIEAVKFTNPNVEVIIQYLIKENNPIALRYNSTECKTGCEESVVKEHYLKDFIKEHTNPSLSNTKYYLYLIGHGILHTKFSQEIQYISKLSNDIKLPINDSLRIKSITHLDINEYSKKLLEFEALNNDVNNNKQYQRFKNHVFKVRDIFKPYDLGVILPKKVKFNIISLDACSLAYIETAYELKDKTKYLAFSQYPIDGDGDALNYTKIIENILLENKISDKSRVKMIVSNFEEHNKSKKTQTFSAVSTNQISQLTDAISSFTKNTSIIIRSGDQNLKSIIKKTANSTFCHAVDENKQNKLSGIDLHHFFTNLKNEISSYPSIALNINNILILLNETIVENYLSNKAFTIGGLSIVYSNDIKVLKNYKKSNKLAFNKLKNNWLEFLFLLTSKN